MRSLWCRLGACLEQHLPHRRRRNGNAETLELADDPFVSPVRVLSRETQDRLAERAPELRSPGPSVLVCPSACDQLPVPAKQRLRLEREDFQAGRGNERLSDASSARSARVNCGRVDCRRRITSSWRRTRISTSFERRGRPSSHTRANRFRTTRYRSDQSKQPPSTTTRAPNLTSSTLRRTADEFANPTGDDSINGGPGTDICIGGPGTDTFNNCETQIQ